mmetsp:Transcript_14221/g.39731  ORF Transcript_14221/g.39731 Transcript_14221/m.39731 type:complete len:81 (-) Transcript_14221:3-245(-)
MSPCEIVGGWLGVELGKNEFPELLGIVEGKLLGTELGIPDGGLLGRALAERLVLERYVPSEGDRQPNPREAPMTQNRLSH